MKFKQEDGTEIDVFTAEEVTAREAAVRTAVEGEYKPQLTEAQQKLNEANIAAAKRAEEFGQFRKLSDEQVAKLDEAQRIVYQNGLLLQQERDKNAEATKVARETSISAAIRTRVGTDQKVFDKVRSMYDLVTLADQSPEQIAARVAAAVGALGQTEPDLLASIGLTASGGYQPPQQQQGDKTFADSEAGKAGAAALGLMTEAPKEK